MPPQPAAAPGPLAMLVPFAMMFLIFYVLVFRPQAKARKEHEGMVKNLKKHDEVVTSGGLFGTVVNVRPESITLRIDENVRVEVEPSAIARLVKSKAKTGEPALAETRK
ncbi:MAG: preprotein translocase subunit YajC [Candidatus Omnitrophica bacterium]|nr:preprotein translocase subunit YajC [Candidatus Omnitrophota bacterium]